MFFLNHHMVDELQLQSNLQNYNFKLTICALFSVCAQLNPISHNKLILYTHVISNITKLSMDYD